MCGKNNNGKKRRRKRKKKKKNDDNENHYHNKKKNQSAFLGVLPCAARAQGATLSINLEDFSTQFVRISNTESK